MISNCFSNSSSLVNRLLSRWFLPVSCAVMGVGGGKTALGNDPHQIGDTTQLFVDDLIIHRKEGVSRRVQQGSKMDKPVVMPEHPWEFAYHHGEDYCRQAHFHLWHRVVRPAPKPIPHVVHESHERRTRFCYTGTGNPRR